MAEENTENWGGQGPPQDPASGNPSATAEPTSTTSGASTAGKPSTAAEPAPATSGASAAGNPSTADETASDTPEAFSCDECRAVSGPLRPGGGRYAGGWFCDACWAACATPPPRPLAAGSQEEANTRAPPPAVPSARGDVLAMEAVPPPPEAAAAEPPPPPPPPRRPRLAAPPPEAASQPQPKAEAAAAEERRGVMICDQCRTPAASGRPGKARYAAGRFCEVCIIWPELDRRQQRLRGAPVLADFTLTGGGARGTRTETPPFFAS